MFGRKIFQRKFILQIIFVFLISGCAGFSRYEKVLKRSEQNIPLWVIAAETNQNISCSQEDQSKDIVFKRNDVYNLSLGIKQFESMISIRMKPIAQDYELKAVYWEYRQKELSVGTKNDYVIWICIAVPKSAYQKALHALDSVVNHRVTK
jgi:hypothetical protein